MLNTPRKTLSVILATWFGIGRISVAPGTCGSLVAVVLAVPIAASGGWVALALAALTVSALGIPIAGAAETAMKRKDPGCIVIDEVAGQWIALVPATINLWSYALAFVLFRIFDIWKPGPIGWADRRLSGGGGIIADDILAGLLAAVGVALLQPFLPPLPRLF